MRGDEAIRNALVVALFLLPLASRAGEPEADVYLGSSWSAHGTPGLSAAVAVNGKMVFSRGYGFVDLDNRVPATPLSVYNIGSVSKPNTAVAVMQLVEQGKVRLDDPIRKYVPSLPETDAAITIRHVMTHTSGIRHYGDDDFPEGWGNENMKPFASLEAAVRALPPYKDALLFAPGQLHCYSSYAVNLLQGVVEVASGLSFEDYMREHVWIPAGMTATAFDRPERIVPHRARAYTIVKGHPQNARYADVTYKFAGGGMISTAEDLVRLGIALNRGLLLKRETVATMYERAEPIPRYQANGSAGKLIRDQALLWGVDETPAGTRISHGGSVKGFEACFANYPERGVVAAVTANADGAPSCEQAFALAKMYLEPAPRRPSTTR